MAQGNEVQATTETNPPTTTAHQEDGDVEEEYHRTTGGSQGGSQNPEPGTGGTQETYLQETKLQELETEPEAHERSSSRMPDVSDPRLHNEHRNSDTGMQSESRTLGRTPAEERSQNSDTDTTGGSAEEGDDNRNTRTRGVEPIEFFMARRTD